jgi:hypothetical protein
MAKKQLGLEEIASEVGRLFGTTEKHARKWLDQRNALLEALGTVRDQANKLMTEIGSGQISKGDIPWPFGAGKRGRKRKIDNNAAPLTDTLGKRRGRRKISDATRAKMRAAAQKRWADKRKAAGGSKRGSFSPR